MLNSIVGVLGNGVVAGDYQSISTVTVGAGGSSSISFTSIPATYTHLQIRGIGKTNKTSPNTDDNLKLTINSGTTYAWHYLLGDGSSAMSGGGTSSTAILQVGLPGATSIAAFSGTVIDILDYTSTNKNKTVRTLSGYDSNGSGYLGLSSAVDYSTPTAITSVTISSWNAATFVQYSSFALYGIKG